jgi:hypothetical protein
MIRDYCEELLDAFGAASHEDIVNRAAPRAARLVGAYQRLCADRDAWKERAERARAELTTLRAGDAGERNAEFIDAALSDDPPEVPR